MSKTYIHYGHKYFDPDIFIEVENVCWNKPIGGLWASDINAKYGWSNWCKDEDYCECKEENSFRFKLKANSKLLTIKSHKDLFTLPIESDVPESFNTKFLCIDFEKLKKKYDAIEVLISEDNRLYYDLYGWDCDSLLVLNKECIEQI